MLIFTVSLKHFIYTAIQIIINCQKHNAHKFMLELRQKQSRNLEREYDYLINLRKFYGNSLCIFKTDTTTSILTFAFKSSLLCVVTCHAYPGNHICWPTTLKRDAMHFTFNICIYETKGTYIKSIENELTWFSSTQPAMEAKTIEMSLFVIRIVVKPTRSPIAISRIDGISWKTENFCGPNNLCSLPFRAGIVSAATTTFPIRAYIT